MRHPVRTDRHDKDDPGSAAREVPSHSGRRVQTAAEKRAVLEDIVTMVRALPEDETSAARSQDFLYGEDGMPA